MLKISLIDKVFHTFSSLNNLKTNFHCFHLSKKLQIFTAVHIFNVLNSAAKTLLSDLRADLRADLILSSELRVHDFAIVLSLK